MRAKGFPARTGRLVAVGWGILVGLGVVTAGIGPGAALGAEIGPEDPLCAAIHGLQPGEELVLRPGDYQGPCTIRRGGRPGAPIVIRAADLQRRPRVAYDGRSANVLEIRARDVTIRGLEFGPTQPDVDAVRIMSGNDITVEDCWFSGLGGIAVVANHVSVHGLTVRRNVIVDSRATAMYFGCHDGAGCMISGLLVEGNYIRRVVAPAGQIGYGLEVKLNSSGIIRDNIIVRTKGPGIMVYGSRDLLSPSVVERNVVVGSDRSSGIVVGGGPAVVRNNVSVENNDAGIGLEDYQGRGLLRGIVITHNTMYGNDAGGISVPRAGLRDVTILNNAAQGRVGAPAFPTPQAGVRMGGNVNCTLLPCFANPDGMDLSPFPGSALTGPGVVGGDESLPSDDLFRVRRGMPPAAGAIERRRGPISLEPAATGLMKRPSAAVPTEEEEER